MAYEYFSHELLSSLIPSNTKRLCIFVSYEERDISYSNVTYSETLAKFFDIVLYVTNEREILHKFSSNIKLIKTSNINWDFGMWFKALRNLDTSNIDQIALVNDSCYLLYPDKLLNILKYHSGIHKFWGLTDSSENGFHIQSFFMVFEKDAISFLKKFVEVISFHTIGNIPKVFIIQRCELGLSKYMTDNGFQMFAVYPYTIVIKMSSNLYEKDHTNAPYFLWDKLLKMGCPLLKRNRVRYPNDEKFIEDFYK